MTKKFGWLAAAMILSACSQAPSTPATPVDSGTTPTTGNVTGDTGGTIDTGTTTPTDGTIVGGGGGGGGTTDGTATDGGTTGGTTGGTSTDGGTATGGSTTTGGDGGGTMTDPALANVAPNDYLISLYRANQGEIALANLALNRSEDEGVREYAQMMLDEHGAATDRIRSLAADMDVTLVSLPNSEAIVAMDRLERINDTRAFDRAYMAFNVMAHERVVGRTRWQAESGMDEDVRALAADLLPDLEEHLEAAQRLSAAVGPDTMANAGMTTSDDDTDN